MLQPPLISEGEKKNGCAFVVAVVFPVKRTNGRNSVWRQLLNHAVQQKSKFIRSPIGTVSHDGRHVEA
jgi:hypothetical protein